MATEELKAGKITSFDVVVTVVCLLLQMVLGGHVSLFGAVPDFLLPACFLIAARHGATVGAVVGFAFGLVFDLLGSGTVGVSAMLGTLAGFFVGKLWFGRVGEVAAATVRFALVSAVYNLLYFTILLLFGDVLAVGMVALVKVFSTVLMESAVALLILFVHAKLSGPTSDRIKL